MHSDAGWDTDHTLLSLRLMAHRPRGLVSCTRLALTLYPSGLGSLYLLLGTSPLLLALTRCTCLALGLYLSGLDYTSAIVKGRT